MTSSNSSSIPLIVWQTWKTKDFPTESIARENAIMKQKNPEYDFRLCTNADCEEFMRTSVPPRVSKAYFSVDPINFGAARADLWRYCVLYVYGGIYLDLDSSIVTPLRLWIQPNDTHILTYENNKFPHDSTTSHLRSLLGTETDTFKPVNVLKNNHLVQWCLISSPRHPFLAEAIAHVTTNILRWSDTLTLSIPPDVRTVNLTGPTAWTISVRRVLSKGQEPPVQYRVLGTDFDGHCTFKIDGCEEKDDGVSYHTAINKRFLRKS